jgi:hypothetical protein
MTAAQDYDRTASLHLRETGHRPVHGVVFGGGWACPALWCGVWDSDITGLPPVSRRRRRLEYARDVVILALLMAAALQAAGLGQYVMSGAITLVWAGYQFYLFTWTAELRRTPRSREERRAKWRARRRVWGLR